MGRIGLRGIIPAEGRSAEEELSSELDSLGCKETDMEEEEEGGRCRLSELAARARLSASMAGVMGPTPRFW